MSVLVRLSQIMCSAPLCKLNFGRQSHVLWPPLGPLHFNCISDLIFESLRDWFSLRVVNSLDDFIVIADSYVDCVKAQNVVISLLRFLGFYVSYSKVTNPSTCTVCLGIEIDSVAMELCLPEGKLVKLVNLLDSYVVR